jgi:hypothetical protein
VTWLRWRWHLARARHRERRLRWLVNQIGADAFPDIAVRLAIVRTVRRRLEMRGP